MRFEEKEYTGFLLFIFRFWMKIDENKTKFENVRAIENVIFISYRKIPKLK